MANGNGLGAHYIVDGSVLTATSNGHPRSGKLVQDFGAGRAHVCSHTWADAKETSSIPDALVAAKPTPISATDQFWTLVNVLALQVTRPPFVPYLLLEPKILIMAAATVLTYQIVTEDNAGAVSLVALRAGLDIHCFSLNDI